MIEVVHGRDEKEEGCQAQEPELPSNSKFKISCGEDNLKGGRGRRGMSCRKGITKSGELSRGEVEKERALKVARCIDLYEELEGDEDAIETDNGLGGANGKMLPHALYHAQYIPACLQGGNHTLESGP